MQNEEVIDGGLRQAHLWTCRFIPLVLGIASVLKCKFYYYLGTARLRPTDQETSIIEKIVCNSLFPRQGHCTPCGEPRGGSSRLSHGAEGTREECGQEALWFPHEGMDGWAGLGLADLGNFNSIWVQGLSLSVWYLVPGWLGKGIVAWMWELHKGDGSEHRFCTGWCAYERHLAGHPSLLVSLEIG